MRFRSGAIFIEIGVGAAAIALVWLISVGSKSLFFPPFQTIAEVFLRTWFSDQFLLHIVPSLRRLLAGYALAVLFGVTLGVLFGLSPTLRLMTRPIVTFLRSIPPPALLPISLVVFGIGDPMKIALIAFVCLWPILLNTEDGVAGIDPTINATARAFQVTGFDRLRLVVLPAIAPRVFAGMRISLSFAVLLIVISEMVASFNGIGYFINNAQMAFAVPEMWAGIILLGLIGYILNALLAVVERRALRWHIEPKATN